MSHYTDDLKNQAAQTDPFVTEFLATRWLSQGSSLLPKSMLLLWWGTWPRLSRPACVRKWGSVSVSPADHTAWWGKLQVQTKSCSTTNFLEFTILTVSDSLLKAVFKGCISPPLPPDPPEAFSQITMILPAVLEGKQKKPLKNRDWSEPAMFNMLNVPYANFKGVLTTDHCCNLSAL